MNYIGHTVNCTVIINRNVFMLYVKSIVHNIVPCQRKANVLRVSNDLIYTRMMFMEVCFVTGQWSSG